MVSVVRSSEELLGWVVLALDLSNSCSQMVAGAGIARGVVARGLPGISPPCSSSLRADFGFSYDSSGHLARMAAVIALGDNSSWQAETALPFELASKVRWSYSCRTLLVTNWVRSLSRFQEGEIRLHFLMGEWQDCRKTHGEILLHPCLENKVCHNLWIYKCTSKSNQQTSDVWKLKYNLLIGWGLPVCYNIYYPIQTVQKEARYESWWLKKTQERLLKRGGLKLSMWDCRERGIQGSGDCMGTKQE